MAIAIKLREYLERQGVKYDLLEHPYTTDSMHTASEAHIPGDYLAKCVLLEDENGYLMAVIPATYRVDLAMLRRLLNRRLGLATEQELADLFQDCELGAIPPIGKAYGIDVVMDENLAQCKEVYFEAGDHTALVHIDGMDFQGLMTGTMCGHFSRHV